MIILASKSPRRQELFGLLGLDFTVKTADIDESMDPRLDPAQEVARISAQKARKIAETAAPDDLIVSADTIVVADGMILGKPKDEQEARWMLHQLSGKVHTVMTGLSVCGEKAKTIVSQSHVHFRTLCDEEVAAYIATGEPMDKAGAYGIQGRASLFVSHLDGDYFSVMGLPLCPLCSLLREFGVQILGA